MGNDTSEKIPSTATFCAGSFWDMEAVFRHVDGIIATSVGFMGGTATAPDYEEVCTGKTGHSEVVMLAYYPAGISYRGLLEIFFRSHNPCKKEQGYYTGSQYDPVVFCHGERDMRQAEEYIRELLHRGVCPEGVVTRISPASAFYRADECHQHFYEKMGTCYPVLQSGNLDSAD